MDPANVPLTLIIWITAPYNLLVAKNFSEERTASYGPSSLPVEAVCF